MVILRIMIAIAMEGGYLSGFEVGIGSGSMMISTMLFLDAATVFLCCI